MKLEKIKYQKEIGWERQLPNHFDSEKTLVLVFGDRGLLTNKYPFESLKSSFPKSQIVGCSTAGTIDNCAISDAQLVATIIKFDSASLKKITTPVGLSEDAFEAGKDIGKHLDAPDLRAILVFADGISINGSELIKGINSKSKSVAIISGGLAADGDRFEKTWTLNNGKPESDIAVGVGIYGDDLKVVSTSQDGLDYFGMERKVTRSVSNHLYELDGVPALNLYKRYLGQLAADLPRSALLFPLAIKEISGFKKQIVRTVLHVDETDQSMTFAGDIPEGSTVRLMRANIDHVIDGADAAGKALRANTGRKIPVLCLAVSCVGRRWMLDERTSEELEAVYKHLPPKSEVAGFYSYGGIAPASFGNSDLHNQTMTLTTFCEE